MAALITTTRAISAANYYSQATAYRALHQASPIIDRLLHPGPWDAWQRYFTAIGLVAAVAAMAREQIFPVPARSPVAFDPEHFRESSL